LIRNAVFGAVSSVALQVSEKKGKLITDDIRDDIRDIESVGHLNPSTNGVEGLVEGELLTKVVEYAARHSLRRRRQPAGVRALSAPFRTGLDSHGCRKH
jgi:hypothetical protein